MGLFGFKRKSPTPPAPSVGSYCWRKADPAALFTFQKLPAGYGLADPVTSKILGSVPESTFRAEYELVSDIRMIQCLDKMLAAKTKQQLEACASVAGLQKYSWILYTRLSARLP